MTATARQVNTSVMGTLSNELEVLLKDVEWGSEEMTRRVTAYIGGMCKQLGVGLALSFTPLADLGMDAAAFLPTAEKLAEIQKLDVVGRNALLRAAWKSGNGSEPPPPRVPAFRNWTLDLVLEAAYRLWKPVEPRA